MIKIPKQLPNEFKGLCSKCIVEKHVWNAFHVVHNSYFISHLQKHVLNVFSKNEFLAHCQKPFQ